jgi:mono/diheme cytochrome c family protein
LSTKYLPANGESSSRVACFRGPLRHGYPSGAPRAAKAWHAVAYFPFAVLLCGALSGCTQEMATQPSYRPLQAGSFFPDGRASQPLVAGTVPRGEVGEVPYTDLAFYTGKSGMADEWAQAAGVIAAYGHPLSGFAQAVVLNPYVEEFPFPITEKVLRRGQERFNIFCAVCHDRAGTGDGMIKRRGFTPPPSFHIPRLRQARVGYFFRVMTRGYGAMPDYAAQVTPRDRWNIVAYIRALQFSGRATLADVPVGERAVLEKGGKAK